MLKQRVITAIVLLALLLPALAASETLFFSGLTLLLIGAAGWEWARLNQVSAVRSVALGLLLASGCVVSWLMGSGLAESRVVWWTSGLIWVVGGAYGLSRGVSGWPRMPRVARIVLGLVVLWAAWLALAAAKSVGINFIMSVFSLVWVSDVAAYFGGRRFGRRKLAPSISPGKSWEGVYSAAVFTLLLAAVWLWIDRSVAVDSQSLYSVAFERLGVFGLTAVVVGLCAMGVVGDLMESLVKRSAGVKDSSGLLPGHGGVLDRIDALLPVFPLAMAIRST